MFVASICYFVSVRVRAGATDRYGPECGVRAWHATSRVGNRVSRVDQRTAKVKAGTTGSVQAV